MTNRKRLSFPIPPKADVFHRKVLTWAQRQFTTATFLHSNGYQDDQYSHFPWIYALGADDVFYGQEKGMFDALRAFADTHDDWLFGFFSYELKNQLEGLTSSNPDHIGMPLCHFFRPVVLIIPGADHYQIACLPGYGELSDPSRVYEMIMQQDPFPERPDVSVHVEARVDRDRYLRQLHAIKQHIQAGDIYEMNYCVEFFDKQANIDPAGLYYALSVASPTPFSCFYMVDDKFLMCASPERFMRKQGERLISQPIKGTIARGVNPSEDEALRKTLAADPKERSENVMIVDLVRNDLSRTAQKDSVKVEELFGVYAFQQVHQMISTVTSRLDPAVHYLDTIRKAFPMGSMTGAPKYRAMQLIDHYEDSCRGIYSGSVGYISPEKDFDFNVVIRSIVYNQKNKYLSYTAGGAITAASVPEKEYEECLLKAKAMEKALQGM